MDISKAAKEALESGKKFGKRVLYLLTTYANHPEWCPKPEDLKGKRIRRALGLKTD